MRDLRFILRSSRFLAICTAVLAASGSIASAQSSGLAVPASSFGSGLQPLPSSGTVPSIVSVFDAIPQDELEQRARVRNYERDLRIIRHRHFGAIRKQELRDQGIRMLGEFTDPAAFQPMINVLARERDDVRLAMLDHFSRQSDEGQGALAWVAIFDASSAMRAEALRRMSVPAATPVKRVLDIALRRKDHAVVGHAANLAASLNVLEAIPLLIFAQAVPDPPAQEQQGVVAWIAIETQRAYVVGLNPVVGDNAGGFAPVMGTVSEGVVLSVVDAVVISYRTEVHDALVAMTTNDWGQTTANLDYNIDAWWQWYNDQYVPFKNEQARKAEIAKPPDSSTANP